MKYLNVFIGIFFTLALTRFIPHPPNFTSLIALGFYVPALLGRRYLPALIISLILTDLIIGLHKTILFTWGSVLFIGLLSNYFRDTLTSRILGTLIGATIFFIVTNFGVWSFGMYGYTLNGFLMCYILALPFFGYTLISTLLYSCLIESVCKFKYLRNLFKFINSQ